MMRDARQASGLFLALLAIVAQLTLATAVASPVVSLADATVFCQHDPTPDAPARPVHQSPDCLLCFFCHSVAGVAGLVATPPSWPMPTSVLVARAVVLPPATAPPPRVVFAARPRGPPIPT